VFILMIPLSRQYALEASRPSCYGYHRKTSPHIDALAADGVRFDNCYISDAPCLPSRTALWSGRCGFHTGLVNHGGVASEPFREGPARGHRDLFERAGWMGLAAPPTSKDA
jgi:arylsulfatase A-like enzyme